MSATDGGAHTPETDAAAAAAATERQPYNGAGSGTAAAPTDRPRGAKGARYSTAVLLTCAALGAAGAVLLVPANWISTVLTAGPLSFIGMGLAGLWILPSVIALRLLKRPLVGILVALIAGLVMVPFSGYGFSSVLTNLWWAAFTELPFLFVIWRYWGTWMHYLGAVAVGVVYPISAWAWFDMGSLGLGFQVAFFAVTLASCVGATALGILVADRLRRAGVGGRTPQPRP